MVKIQVTDINDNRPVFYTREYNVSLLDAPQIELNKPVVSVVATDQDSGAFGQVVYHIVAGNEKDIFALDRNTGALSISRPSLLANPARRVHRLNVSATDGGGLRTLQDAVVYISVIDVRNRPPIFRQSLYQCHVKEDAPVGTTVGTVLASSNVSGRWSRVGDV